MANGFFSMTGLRRSVEKISISNLQSYFDLYKGYKLAVFHFHILVISISSLDGTLHYLGNYDLYLGCKVVMICFHIANVVLTCTEAK